MFKINIIFVCLIAFSSGVIISGAVFAFITIIGIVPRLAEKTQTFKYVMLYEESIIFGGIIGAIFTFSDITFKLPGILVIILSFCVGIFYGCLAISLAEVLDVLPILRRRLNLNKGLYILVLSISLGKLIGSILYYTKTGFFEA